MKLELVAKLDKKNGNFKKLDGDVMSGNCVLIITFLIYRQFGAIR